MLAREEALLLGHRFIGTEHILLGLIEEKGMAAKALESLGISFDAARAKIEETIGPAGPGPDWMNEPPFTPRAKKVLELSGREARRSGNNDIGPEHMLLGLVDEGEGVAVQVLVDLGADLSRVRQQVIAILSGDQPTEPRRGPKQPLADLRSSRGAPRCGVCRASLTDSLTYQIVEVRPAGGTSSAMDEPDRADGDDPIVQVTLVYCASCGVTLCSSPLLGGEPPIAPPTPG